MTIIDIVLLGMFFLACIFVIYTRSLEKRLNKLEEKLHKIIQYSDELLDMSYRTHYINKALLAHLKRANAIKDEKINEMISEMMKEDDEVAYYAKESKC